jgi:hypothetical protein
MLTNKIKMKSFTLPQFCFRGGGSQFGGCPLPSTRLGSSFFLFLFALQYAYAIFEKVAKEYADTVYSRHQRIILFSK